MSDTDQPPVERLHVGVVITCALIVLIDGFDTQSIAFAAPAIAESWHIGKGSFGPIFGAGLAGGLLGAIMLGRAGDRIGHRRILVSSVIFFAAMSFFTAHSNSITSLIILRFLTGIGLTGAVPSAIAITCRHTPLRMRATIITCVYAGFPLGAVMGGAISAGIIGSMGWPAIFYLGALAPVLVIPVLYAFIPRDRPDARQKIVGRDAHYQSPPPDRPETLLSTIGLSDLFGRKWRRLTIIMWLTCFSGLVLTYLLINWLPMILHDGGATLSYAIYGTVMLNLGSIVGSIALGSLTDRYGVARVLSPAFLGGAAIVIAMGFVRQSPMAMMVLIFILGALCVGAQIATYSSIAICYPSELRSTGVGWSLGIGRIGSIVGPVGAGFLLAIGLGPRGLFFVASIPAVLAAAALFGIPRQSPIR